MYKTLINSYVKTKRRDSVRPVKYPFISKILSKFTTQFWDLFLIKLQITYIIKETEDTSYYILP